MLEKAGRAVCAHCFDAEAVERCPVCQCIVCLPCRSHGCRLDRPLVFSLPGALRSIDERGEVGLVSTLEPGQGTLGQATRLPLEMKLVDLASGRYLFDLRNAAQLGYSDFHLWPTIVPPQKLLVGIRKFDRVFLGVCSIRQAAFRKLDLPGLFNPIRHLESTEDGAVALVIRSDGAIHTIALKGKNGGKVVTHRSLDGTDFSCSAMSSRCGLLALAGPSKLKLLGLPLLKRQWSLPARDPVWIGLSNRKLVVLGRDGSLDQYEAGTKGPPVQPTIRLALSVNGAAQKDGGGTGQPIMAALSPDGELLALQQSAHALLVVRLTTAELQLVSATKEAISLIRFIRAGRVLAVGHHDGQLFLFPRQPGGMLVATGG